MQFHESADTLMENGALSDCPGKHLAALPENQRTALLLYEAHQHKSEDICNILDVSASNLRVLLHRAQQKILLMVESFQETGEYRTWRKSPATTLTASWIPGRTCR